MKILMVAPTPFFADRGCHVRILGEWQGLRDLGHEVLLCTYPLGRDLPGYPTLRTWPVPWYRKLSAGPSWHKYYIDLLLLGLVRRSIRRWQPDVIHAHLHEGACISAWALGRRRIPLVLDYQGSLTEEVVAHRFTKSGSLQYRWLRRLEGWIDRRADAVITSTGMAAAYIREQFDVPADRVHVVTDGVDVQQFQPGRHPASAISQRAGGRDLARPGAAPQAPEAHVDGGDGHTVRQRYGIPEGRPLIIYTGLLNAYQGIDVLLEALSRVKRSGAPFHALIVGFPDVERYREQAEALGLADCVTLPGRVAYEEIPELLASADIGVSAKLPGSEGNIKLYTYLAAGLPTVAFDTPMNREIIAETGVLVPRVDADALARGLAELLAGEERRRDLSRLARERAVERFSWRSVAQRIAQVYDETIAQHKGRH